MPQPARIPDIVGQGSLDGSAFLNNWERVVNWAHQAVHKLIYGYDSYPWAKPWIKVYPFGGEIDPGNWDYWVVGGPGLAPYFNGYPNIQYASTAHYFKYLFFNDPDYDIHDFDPNNPDDMAKLQPAADLVNATETDLSAFKANGGKMIMYNGWSDPCITPLGTINYYTDLTYSGVWKIAADSKKVSMWSDFYYGFFSNRARGDRKKKAKCDEFPALMEPEVSSKELPRSWARLIQKIYHVDPLICPKRRGKMKIVAFIDTGNVIEKILNKSAL